MTRVEKLAEFVVRASFDSLSNATRKQRKIHMLDSLGCALAALDSEPARILRRHIEEFDGAGRCTLMGGGDAQTAIEAILELRRQHKIIPDEIRHIEVEIFDVAYHIIGGGAEGDKTIVATKEQADHSLPYILAVALLDGQVKPEQYLPERIQRQDVQRLLHQISIQPDDEYSARFPNEMPCRITVWLRDGRKLSKETRDYPGFHTLPMSWEIALKKYEHLADPYTAASLRTSIAETVAHLEEADVTGLMQLLKKARTAIPEPEAAARDLIRRKKP